MTHADGERMGTGPWARLLASAVVPDESSSRAERGRTLARTGGVRGLEVVPGAIRARVRGSRGNEYAVSLETSPIPERSWRAVVQAARGNAQLEAGVEGASQSVHLVHWLETEHAVSLVPQSRSIGRRCTCPDHELTSACKHVAATAFAAAEAIDRDPALLLRFRGCEPAPPPAARNADPWQGGALPAPRAVRPLPPGAVLKRLGRSGIRVDGRDLAEALEPAYRAFAALAAERRVP